DVLIAVSIMPYSRETIEACHFARERGMKVVMISDSDVISPRFHPDHLLRADVLSTHHFGSFSGMTALVEVLLALMMARGGEAARARIRAYEAVRLANNAYWPTKKT
ncbi:MAG: SIS domain-containing protein, partial [Alphaproteobacteria bacterium]